MPAHSKHQQHAAGMAYAIKKGDMPMSKARGAVKEMVQGMSGKQLKEYASSKKGKR